MHFAESMATFQTRIAMRSYWLSSILLLNAVLIGCQKTEETTTSGGAPSTTTVAARQADDELGGIVVPNGDANELFTFMVDLQNQPLPDDVEEKSNVVRYRMRARVVAADKILQQDLPPESRTSAVQMKLDALRMLSIVDPDGVGKQFKVYSDQLIQGRDPFLARLAKAILFQAKINDFVSYGNDQPQELLTALDTLLADSEAGPTTFQAARDAAQWVFPAQDANLDADGFRERISLSAQFFERIGNRFLNSENQELATEAQTLLMQADDLSLTAKGEMALAGKEGAVADLTNYLNGMMSKDQPHSNAVPFAIQTAQMLEFAGMFEPALSIYRMTFEKFKDRGDKELASTLQGTLQTAEARLNLVGKDFVVEGIQADGSKFDWSQYQGKHVIVFFWTSRFEFWDQEVENIANQVKAFGEERIKVVTVNLDEQREMADGFLKDHPIAWPVVVSPDPSQSGWDSPMVAKYGVEAIPFVVLIGPDGKVIDLHVFGERLFTALEKELGATSSIRYDNFLRTVAFLGPQTEDHASDSKDEVDHAIDLESRNPYSAPEKLSPQELLEYIWDMEEKPKSIQQRDGFSAAIVEAAERIIASDASEKFKTQAVLAQLKFLHRDAWLETANADKLLVAAIDRWADDDRGPIKKEINFLRLEQKTLNADELEPEARAALLTELREFMASNSLGERHLRMASNSVALINQIEDANAREPLFVEFGQLFAKSDHKPLARYGKKIAATEKNPTSNLVGTELKLAGITTDGLAVDVNKLRGQYVVVDFWATWCGPCIRAIPELETLQAKFADKQVQVIGVSLDEDLEALGKFLEKKPLNWPVLSGEGVDDVATEYSIRAIPTLMLISPEGLIVEVTHKVTEIHQKLSAQFPDVDDPDTTDNQPSE